MGYCGEFGHALQASVWYEFVKSKSVSISTQWAIAQNSALLTIMQDLVIRYSAAFGLAPWAIACATKYHGAEPHNIFL
jgi:hypothetical protein